MTDANEPSSLPSQLGRPLFNDPEARALKRVGVVDVGSNSVRMVIFDGAARSPAYFYNEKVMCGLGQGLQETGRLHPEGRVRAFAALRRFQALAEGMGIAPLATVATAAVRDASDGPEFCEEVYEKIGMKLHVIDGQEEARLSAQGVLLGWPGSEGVVCDIGGASMELAMLEDGKVGARMTSDLGPLKITSIEGVKQQRQHVKDRLAGMLKNLSQAHGQRLFLVGGSWRAIAKIDMVRRNYPLHVLHEYRMTCEDINATVDLISENDPTELRQRCGISSARMVLVPIASKVLRELVRTFEPRDICVSSYGIREGVLYEQMPQKLRELDPLIEASWFLESRDARLPGFGTQLHEFLHPLFKDANQERQRLVKSACLLHDVNWRSHPDYRGDVCFELATRGNFGGLAHWERAFLGISLMYRYSSKPTPAQFEPVLTLLEQKDIRQAQILGKAMRLGTMLCHGSADRPATLQLDEGQGILQMTLNPEAAPLYGEVVEARLNSLCATLGVSPKVLGI